MEMEIKDWITIGSVLAVILGWFINSHLNRRHEVFKRKMDLRFGMYESCTAVSQLLEKIIQSKDKSKEALDPLASDFVKKLELCQVQVHMYGTQREIESIVKVTEFAQGNKHNDMKNEFAALMRSIRDSLRKDLKLPKLTLNDET